MQIVVNLPITEENGAAFPVQILMEDLTPKMKKYLIVLAAIPACIILVPVEELYWEFGLFVFSAESFLHSFASSFLPHLFIPC